MIKLERYNDKQSTYNLIYLNNPNAYYGMQHKQPNDIYTKRPTPPCLNKAWSPMQTEDTRREGKKVGGVERDANPAKFEGTH